MFLFFNALNEQSEKAYFYHEKTPALLIYNKLK